MSQETIVSCGNVAVPAYLTLKTLGFEITSSSDNEQETWRAEKGDLVLIGDSTLEILGLYFLRQQRGSDWKASDNEIDDFLNRFYPGQN